MCEGDTNAYGQVYYSVNGGPWTPTGQAKYYNQSKWRYEVIHDTAFNNVSELQFGFRWVNPISMHTSDISFSVDDIVAAGVYDSINPTKFSILELIDTPICQGDIGYALIEISPPLCGGNYVLQMSDANGSFANPYNGPYYYPLSAADTFIFAQIVPSQNMHGNCFRVRFVRTDPFPYIIGDTSACFSIMQCNNVVYNVTAPVMNDIDTACILSELDVHFNSGNANGSGGVFGHNNIYYAQLSDTLGNFANPTTLGHLATSDSFPIYNPQGNIQCVIPSGVIPACGYYIRVYSTNPYSVSDSIGPFCLTKCDVLTNNQTDIHFCVASGPYPQCDTIQIHPHQWNNHVNYDACNDWSLQLLDMTTLNIVNTGGLAVYHDTTGGNFKLCIPSTVDSLPVPAGEYYMRIVSSCGSQPWNETGTIIRVIIGAPSATPPVLRLSPAGDSTFCRGSTISIFISPFNHPPSNYIWSSNLLFGGNDFEWDGPNLGIITQSYTPIGSYSALVHEINYGCVGTESIPLNFYIISKPNLSISGPLTVCIGDTVNYDVTFIEETYYHWWAPAGVQIFNTSNRQTGMIFNSTGTYTISNSSLNKCGTDSDTYHVTVVPPFNLNIGNDTTICAGQSLTLVAETPNFHRQFQSSDTAHTGYPGAMFNIKAHNDVTIDSFAVKYLSTQALQVEIWGKPGSYRNFEQSSSNWNELGSFYNFPPAPLGQMTEIPIHINQHISAGDTFAFYVTSSNNINEAIGNGIGIQQGVVYKTDGVVDFIQGTANEYPFGTFSGPKALNLVIYYTSNAGIQYQWNTGDTTSQIYIAPMHDTAYSVIVSDTGCVNRDTILVNVSTSPPCVESISENNRLTGIKLVPNPASDEFEIINTGGTIIRSAILIDGLGREIPLKYKRQGENIVADIRALVSGLYYVKVFTHNGSLLLKLEKY